MGLMSDAFDARVRARENADDVEKGGKRDRDVCVAETIEEIAGSTETDRFRRRVEVDGRREKIGFNHGGGGRRRERKCVTELEKRFLRGVGPRGRRREGEGRR